MKLNSTVLIADDDPEMVSALALRCKTLGLSVSTAETGIIAILKASKSPPDLLIVDIGMPEGDGFKVCDRLLELHIVFPVIVLTGRSDAETIRRCEALGGHHVLKDADMWSRLEPLIKRLLEGYGTASSGPKVSPAPHELSENTETVPTVLAVDDDPAITKAIKIRLKAHGIETLEASDGLQGYRMAQKHAPDVIISDYTMPEGSGDHMLIRLQEGARTRSIPVILLTGQTFEGKTDVALKRDILGRRGASAYLAKPIDFDELLAEIKRHISLELAESAEAGAG